MPIRDSAPGSGRDIGVVSSPTMHRVEPHTAKQGPQCRTVASRPQWRPSTYMFFERTLGDTSSTNFVTHAGCRCDVHLTRSPALGQPSYPPTLLPSYPHVGPLHLAIERPKKGCPERKNVADVTTALGRRREAHHEWLNLQKRPILGGADRGNVGHERSLVGTHDS